MRISTNGRRRASPGRDPARHRGTGMRGAQSVGGEVPRDRRRGVHPARLRAHDGGRGHPDRAHGGQRRAGAGRARAGGLRFCERVGGGRDPEAPHHRDRGRPRGGCLHRRVEGEVRAGGASGGGGRRGGRAHSVDRARRLDRNQAHRPAAGRRRHRGVGGDQEAPGLDMSPAAASPWSPLGQRPFAVIWTATLVSNIGGWMYAAAAGWLMTSLDSSPLVVSLVQVATTLPIFLFAMPAGALTDSLDKRRFLLWGEGFIAVTSAPMAGLVWLDLVTAPRLLILAFLVSAGDALTAPPWQAVVPLLVPPAELRPAVAANGVGFNISRALGPALGGALVGPFGIAAPFIVNAVSNFGVIGALVWWRAPRHTSSGLPPERLWSAMRTGLRYARFSPPLRDTLIRAAGFFLFASAYWALLPLVARSQLAGGPTLYGILLGGIGASAVAGAFALPWLNTRLGPDRLAVAGALGTAAATALFGLTHDVATALLASVIAGIAWI